MPAWRALCEHGFDVLALEACGTFGPKRAVLQYEGAEQVGRAGHSRRPLPR